MGLNLNTLASLKNTANTNNTKETSANQSESPIQQLQIVHNATSQSTQKSSATSVLESLATGSTTAKSKVEGTPTSVQGNQSSTISSRTNEPETARTIKYQEVSDTIFKLREAIHSAHPKMPGLLQEIWQTLQSYPEQVTLLEEDQMKIIISGLEKVVDTDLANITLKAATSGKKAKAALTMGSLGF